MRRFPLAGAVVAVACVLSLAGSDALAQPSDGTSDIRGLIDAVQLRDSALGTLRIVDESVKRCLALQQDAGDNADVAKVLNGIRVKPGSLDFVSPDTLADLQRAAGRRINLTHADLELCVRAFDIHARVVPNPSRPPMFRDGVPDPLRPGPRHLLAYRADVDAGDKRALGRRGPRA